MKKKEQNFKKTLKKYSNSQNQAIFSINVKPAYVFAGLILIIIGSLIIVYDYPQLEYLKNQEGRVTESESFNIRERLQIEFTIGIIILIAGITLGVYGVIKKIKDFLAK